MATEDELVRELFIAIKAQNYNKIVELVEREHVVSFFSFFYFILFYFIYFLFFFNFFNIEFKLFIIFFY
mgnify:CR=1 FL=1